MLRFGFRSVFSKLFTSVMLTLVLFAIAMMTLTHLVHDNSAYTRWQVLAKQITHQIDPLLEDLKIELDDNNLLHARFTLAVIKKSFDIFDESLQANLGLYDAQGRLLVQTDGSNLPSVLPEEQSWLATMLPSFSDQPANHSVQAVSKNGFTLLYESRQPPVRSELSAAFNLLTGTLLLLMIMTLMLWWISHSITWRLNKMSQQIIELGEGNFSARMPEQGNDEIASLGRGFNQAAQKIEQLINANNLLLAHASHELRTPITRIRLQVEMMDMLASGIPAPAKERFDKRAQAINRDLNGLNDLVESILLVSRLDAGHAVQQVERFDLYELLAQECQHYKEARLFGEHIVIQGQPKLLVHLIRNLLNNALIHGKPPIIIHLYGVTTLDDAYNVPEYIITKMNDMENDDFNDDGGDGGDDSDDSDDSNDIDNVIKDDLSADKTDQLSHNSDDDNSGATADNNDNMQQDIDINHTPVQDKENTSKGLLDKGLLDKGLSDNAQVTTASKNEQNKPDKEQRTNAAELISRADKAKTSLLTELADNRLAKRLRQPKTITEVPKYAVIGVIDKGAGIPLDKRKDIFSPFVRLQQKKKGSGLGLSLVAQIIEAHNGYIMTDTLGGHTRFLVILPVKTSINAGLNTSPKTSINNRANKPNDLLKPNDTL